MSPLLSTEKPYDAKRPRRGRRRPEPLAALSMVVVVALALAAGAPRPASANTAANLYFHGGPMYNMTVNVLFWGTGTTGTGPLNTLPNAAANALIQRLTDLSAFLNGSPVFNIPGYQPTIRAYGAWGIMKGAVTFDASAATFHVNTLAQPPYNYISTDLVVPRIEAAQANGLLPPEDLSEFTVVVIPDGFKVVDQQGNTEAAFHGASGSHRFAVVALSNLYGLSHEIMEAATDPVWYDGWATDEGFLGATHYEGADGGCDNFPDSSGFASFTSDMAFQQYPGLGTDSCQIVIPEQYAPIAVAQSGYEARIYTIGGDGGLRRTYGALSSHPFQSDLIGWPAAGVWAAGKPSVITYGGADLVFVRGTDNQLYLWGEGPSWVNLGSPNARGFYGNPSAVVWDWNGSSTINIFLLGADLHLWSLAFTGSWNWGCVDWSHTYNAPPVAISRASNTLDVFLSSNNLHLSRYWFDGANWQGPQGIAGALQINTGRGQAFRTVNVVAPAGVSTWGSTNLELFVKGDLGPSVTSIVHTTFNGTAWTALDSRGDIAVGNSGSIATVSWGPNRVDAFVIDTGKQTMYHTARAGSVWTSETLVAPVAGDSTSGATGDPVATSGYSGSFDVYYRDVSGNLHQGHYDGWGWSNWVLANEVIH